MNWALNWTQPNWGLLGIALLLVAMGAAPKRLWPMGRFARVVTRSLMVFGAIAAGAAAVLVEPPAPLTMKECLGTLSSGQSRGVADVTPTNNPPSPWIGMKSGPRDQTYYRLGTELAEVANAHGIPLVNGPSGGSFDNLAMVLSPLNVAIVFTQADVLERAPPEQQKRLRMVVALYEEEIHVFARREVISRAGVPAGSLQRLSDLRDRRVLVSARSDGSAYTANRLMRLARVMPAGAKVEPISPIEGLCSVLVGTAEAMVVVAGQPVAQLRELQRLSMHPAHPLSQVQLLPLSRSDLQDKSELGESAAFYEPARIDRRSYPWAFAHDDDERRPIPTLSVRALLMSYDFSPRITAAQQQKCAAISAVVKLLKDPEVIARLCQVPNHPKWCQLDTNASVPVWQPNACL